MLDYGYLSAKDTYESVEDIVYYALTSPHNVDSMDLLENLSKLDYDHEDAIRLRKFLSWATESNEDSWKFFDETSEKEGTRKLIEFSQDIEDMVSSKSGIKWIIRLTDNPRFDDDDEIINKYKTGKLLYTDGDYVRFYGYKEPPKAIEPDPEEIIAEINREVNFTAPIESELYDSDVFDMLQSSYPREAFYDRVDYLYKDEINQLRDEAVDSLREKFPMVSRDDLEQYLIDTCGDIMPPFDRLMDEKYCFVLELNDRSFPISETENGPVLSDSSSLELLYEKMGYSLEDINKALQKGVPDKIDSFPASLAAEYAATGEDPNLSTVILLRCPLGELLDQESTVIKIPAGTRCGFFDSINGSGGEFGIMIEKDVTLPKAAFSSINVDYRPQGSRTYSVREVYSSLEDELWEPKYSAKTLKKLLPLEHCK